MESSESPRISFSHDLSESQPGKWPLDPEAADFDFSVSIQISDHEPATADQLFSRGKILPIPLKARGNTPLPLPLPPINSNGQKKGSLREVMAEEDNVKRSCWRLGRSISTGNTSRSNSICSFLLARSKSTSFADYPKKKPITYYQNNNKSKSNKRGTRSDNWRKGSTGPNHVIRISPVLNLSIPHIQNRRGAAGVNGCRAISTLLAYLLCNCKNNNI